MGAGCSLLFLCTDGEGRSGGTGCWISPVLAGHWWLSSPTVGAAGPARRWLLDGRGKRAKGEEERGTTGEGRKRGGEERVAGYCCRRRRERR
uniref:Putative ovule protein n=1 Tax=Solanum chacoense TaxID=4108 RepID=A0A0V0IUM9_SOLCH